MRMKQQFNVPVDSVLAKRVKLDAVQIEIPLQEWARIAFENFLRLPKNQRRGAAVTARKKLIGRPVKP